MSTPLLGKSTLLLCGALALSSATVMITPSYSDPQISAVSMQSPARSDRCVKIGDYRIGHCRQ